MTATMNYTCGCVNAVDERFGASYSVAKCDQHRSQQLPIASLNEYYYRRLGALAPESPPRYIQQFEDAFGAVRTAGEFTHAMEIGPGVSFYVPMLMAAGWQYHAVEPSGWAAGWLVHQWGPQGMVYISPTAWELYAFGDCQESECEVLSQGGYGLILSAHSLEHMADAPAMLQKMVHCLAPGGALYLIIPDDTDPVNPDHLWFFSCRSLRSLLESAGMTVEIMEIRRYVEHENTIYCLATKPLPQSVAEAP